ncbi:MAG: glycosyltransferase family 1 protein [Burkholderiales bacterium]|nr:glycosyltransferase family 1 protein [Burkholderiales bacterium]
MTSSQMHYVIVTGGSMGDIHPFLKVAQTLQQCGRKVTFVGTAVHADLVHQAGFSFVGVGTVDEYHELVRNPDLWHPQKSFAALFQNYRTNLDRAYRDIVDLVGSGPCVVVAHPFALPLASMVRETCPQVQVVGTYLAPSNLRTCHDPLYMGPTHIPTWVPMSWRRTLWHWIDRYLVDPIAVSEVNAVRTAHGLSPIQSFLPHMQAVPDVSVTLFPAWFAVPYADWPQPLCVGDFPLFDPASSKPLPDDAARFLDQGSRPVVVTPGTANAHAKDLFASAVRAAKRLGLRMLFLTPHREQLPASLPDTIHWQPYVSLQTLLPLAQGLIYHGGIGTLAEAMRAGVPQVVVPFAWDQFDNAARVKALGVGEVIPGRGVSARKLIRALRSTVMSESVQAHCQQVAHRAQQVHSPAEVFRAVEQLLDIESTEQGDGGAPKK